MFTLYIVNAKIIRDFIFRIGLHGSHDMQLADKSVCMRVALKEFHFANGITEM